eukprot:2333137-Alexandrium_andersonii.AAC.1
MSASLVGSEMCIRDRHRHSARHRRRQQTCFSVPGGVRSKLRQRCASECDCLLYTSDAADDM